MRNTLFALPLLLLAACHANDDGPVACEKDTAELLANTCVDSTGSYDIGDVWICPDNCNFCGCLEYGVIFSTGMVCDTIPTDTDTDTDADTDTDTDTGTTPTDTGDTIPADTGTDTGASDTGGGDTSSG